MFSLQNKLGVAAVMRPWTEVFGVVVFVSCAANQGTWQLGLSSNGLLASGHHAIMTQRGTQTAHRSNSTESSPSDETLLQKRH